MKVNTNKMQRECPECGKTFWTTMRMKVYCSRECSKAHHNRAARERYQQLEFGFTCARCGKEFRSNRNLYDMRGGFCPACMQESKRRRTKKLPKSYKREKMKKISASGLTYGQYMAGNKQRIPATFKGTIPAMQNNGPWMDSDKPIPVAKPTGKASLKCDPGRLPVSLLPPTKDTHSPDDDCDYTGFFLSEERAREIRRFHDGKT